MTPVAAFPSRFLQLIIFGSDCFDGSWSLMAKYMKLKTVDSSIDLLYQHLACGSEQFDLCVTLYVEVVLCMTRDCLRSCPESLSYLSLTANARPLFNSIAVLPPRLR